MAKIVTITNPLTGQPAQVDQLEHTAQQIDDGLNIARGVSNPNLLDNWYLGNPVDQRQGYVVPPGVTFYASTDTALSTPLGTTAAYDTVVERNSTYAKFVNASGAYYLVAASDAVRGYTGAGYGIDRWKFYGNVLLITDSGIKFSDSIVQVIDPELIKELTGKTVTASILLSDGTLVCGTNTFSLGGTFIGNPTCLINNSAEFQIYSASEITVKAAKLELGTQQTLAHQDADGNWQLNEIPDYGEQLARCQMRQIVLDATPGFAVGRCFKASDTSGHLMIPVPYSFGNGNVAVVTTGDFRNVGYNVYADIPSSALSTTGRVVGGMCVIGINANVVGDGMLDSGSSGRIVLDRNL